MIAITKSRIHCTIVTVPRRRFFAGVVLTKCIP
jgi:hypothetical protein